MERQYLFDKIYEKLRTYSVDNFNIDLMVGFGIVLMMHAIYFLMIRFLFSLQLVDMRWGLEDEAIDLNLIKKICFEQIESCQTDSIDPYFVVIFNYRYFEH
jgi:hypothetical protein